MPYDAFLDYADSKEKWNFEKVIDAEQFFQVSHQAMIHRLVQDGFVDGNIAEGYKAVTVSTVAARM